MRETGEKSVCFLPPGCFPDYFRECIVFAGKRVYFPSTKASPTEAATSRTLCSSRLQETLLSYQEERLTWSACSPQEIPRASTQHVLVTLSSSIVYAVTRLCGLKSAIAQSLHAYLKRDTSHRPRALFDVCVGWEKIPVHRNASKRKHTCGRNNIQRQFSSAVLITVRGAKNRGSFLSTR